MRETYEKTLQYFGRQAQIEKCVEELEELSIELYRDLGGNGSREAIILEIADVLNMLMQVQIIFDISLNEIEAAKEFKMDRTLNYMRKHKNEEDNDVTD